MSAELRRLGPCHHCGNTTVHRLLAKHGFHGEGSWFGNLASELDGPDYYYIAACETCGRVILYQGASEIEPSDEWQGMEPASVEEFRTAHLVFPQGDSAVSVSFLICGPLGGSVPASINEICREAYRIKDTAPNAFVVMIRKALEAVCDDRGARQGNLVTRLGYLSASQQVPPTLAEMGGLIRLLGNIGAHADGVSVDAELADVVDQFFRAIIEYVYIAPAKIAEIREAVSRLIGHKG